MGKGHLGPPGHVTRSARCPVTLPELGPTESHVLDPNEGRGGRGEVEDEAEGQGRRGGCRGRPLGRQHGPGVLSLLGRAGKRLQSSQDKRQGCVCSDRGLWPLRRCPVLSAQLPLPSRIVVASRGFSGKILQAEQAGWVQTRGGKQRRGGRRDPGEAWGSQAGPLRVPGVWIGEREIKQSALNLWPVWGDPIWLEKRGGW